MGVVKTYYRLTKPGIIYGNAIPLVAGFFLASRGHYNFVILIAVAIGTSLVIGGSCVLNNYIDRDIDRLMARTKKRAFVEDTINVRLALIYAVVLILAGLGILAACTNLVTVLLGIAGVYLYVVVYGIWKRRSTWGTAVGSISGALPPVAGYTAVTGRIDGGALILFLILTFWQMPHFFAIATYRREDYARAKLPVLPVAKGIAETKRQIMIYTVLFVISTLLLTVFHYTGYVYLIIAIILGAYWLDHARKAWAAPDDNKWARKMFGRSLLVLTALSVAIAVGPLLP